MQAGPPEGKGWRRNLDTQAPTVSITSPTSGTTYTTAQTVTISASASDNVGVSKVEFYLNGALHSTDTSPPYNASWPITSANNGSHAWSARAYDAAGNNATSTTVSLTVNIASSDSTDTTPPTVTITSPASGTTYTTAQTVTISASASDNVGVSKVEFYQNGVLRSTHSSAPYSVGWSISSAQNGTHSWTAKAFDTAGNTNTSTAVSLTVNIADSNDTDNTKQESGAHLWSQNFGDNRTDRGQGVAVDGNGNVVMAGRYYGAVNFGAGMLACSDNKTHMVVAKYSADGAPLWAVCGNAGTGFILANAVAIDPQGNVLVTGGFSGTVYLGNISLSSSGGTDTFVAKYSASGTLVWVRQVGSSLNDTGYDVASDSAGNVLTTGAAFNQNNKAVIYVSKYTPSGTLLWSQNFIGEGNNFGRGITVDSQDNILVTGHFYGAMQLEGTTHTVGNNSSVSFPGILLAKFDAYGKLFWAEQIGGDDEEYSTAIAVDKSSGDIVITGYFFGTTDFGGGELGSIGYDIFLARYNTNGRHLWSKSFSNMGREAGWDVAIEPITGDVFLTGTFNRDASFGGSMLARKGSSDTFIARYRSDTGKHVWSKAFGGENSSTSLQGISLDETGTALFATGYFNSSVDFGGGALTGDAIYGDIILLKLVP